MRVILVTSALFSHGLIHATTLPAGEQLVLRLDTKISSRSSRAGDLVQASVMGGADRSPQFLALSGATVEGRLEDVRRGEPLFHHAFVQIRFFRIRFGLRSTEAKLRIVEVHNAAESIDRKGIIRGLTPLWIRPAKINITFQRTQCQSPHSDLLAARLLPRAQVAGHAWATSPTLHSKAPQRKPLYGGSVAFSLNAYTLPKLVCTAPLGRRRDSLSLFVSGGSAVEKKCWAFFKKPRTS
jgi:hypothetical protein